MRCWINEVLGWWSIRLIKYQVDEVSGWWSIRLMKYQFEEAWRPWSIGTMKYWVNELFCWWNIGVDEVLGWWWIESMKYWDDEVLSQWSIRLMKHGVDEVLWWWIIESMKYWDEGLSGRWIFQSMRYHFSTSSSKKFLTLAVQDFLAIFAFRQTSSFRIDVFLTYKWDATYFSCCLLFSMLCQVRKFYLFLSINATMFDHEVWYNEMGINLKVFYLTLVNKMMLMITSCFIVFPNSIIQHKNAKCHNSRNWQSFHTFHKNHILSCVIEMWNTSDDSEGIGQKSQLWTKSIKLIAIKVIFVHVQSQNTYN